MSSFFGVIGRCCCEVCVGAVGVAGDEEEFVVVLLLVVVVVVVVVVVLLLLLFIVVAAVVAEFCSVGLSLGLLFNDVMVYSSDASILTDTKKFVDFLRDNNKIVDSLDQKFPSIPSDWVFFVVGYWLTFFIRLTG